MIRSMPESFANPSSLYVWGSNSHSEIGLSEDLVNYGVLSAEVDGRRRHVFFCYVGSSTSALKRGRASMHAPHLEKFFDGTVGSLPTLTSPDELDETHVSGLLRQVCKGATTVEVS